MFAGAKIGFQFIPPCGPRDAQFHERIIPTNYKREILFHSNTLARTLRSVMN